MSDNPQKKIARFNGGMLYSLTNRFKLIARLMADPRVNPMIKLLPIGTLIYLVIPDLLIGPFDDAAIIWLGTYLFVELCPPYVVEEIQRSLEQVIPAVGEDPLGGSKSSTASEDIIDGEYQDIP